jgi:hypothetical protein
MFLLRPLRRPDMMLRVPRPGFALTALVFLACAPICAAVCGCVQRPAPVQPTVELTTVPEATAGGTDKMARIAGRVTGAGPGHRIVLYTKSDVWWVQPLTVQPFTTVQADSTWENTIHLGSEYAALLVDGRFQPPATTTRLPQRGESVIAVATAKGIGSYATATPKALTFSGYEWEVRQIPSDRGGQNEYDPANAWTDAEGLLHLRLARRPDGRWTSAEVILTRALGYGTYAFTVRDTSTLDPAAALGMLTWDEQGLDQNHRELDIEISQWGDPIIPNAQYVLQPFYVPANVARFSAPRGTLTHSLRWEPGRASFRTTRGKNAMAGDVVAQHEFTSGVPSPGAERVRMNLYYFRYAPKPPQKDVEVVIERFQYLP